MANLDDEDRDFLRDQFDLHLTPIRSDLYRHEKALFGNGRAGVIEDVAALKVERKRNRINAAGIGTIAGSIAGFAIDLWSKKP